MVTLAFWIDVDNTLITNDDVKRDWDAHLQVELGPQLTARFWELYEQARQETGVVDIPLALARLRQETPLTAMDEQTYLHVHSLFDNDLAEAVEGRVLIYDHKQQHLQEIMQQYPADHYVIIDDRPDILANAKSMLGDRLTTVLVKQGKYAAGPMPANFTPDIVVSHIADLRNYSAEQFAGSHNR